MLNRILPVHAPALAKVRALLAASAFDEAPVSRRLGLGSIAALATEHFPARRSALGPDADPLSALIWIFLLEAELSDGEAARAFGAAGLASLLSLGLVARLPGGRLAARAALYPCCGAVIATDRRTTIGTGRAARRNDRVMYLGPDSYLLARLAPEPPAGGTVLDLCTGSGVHAILAAGRGARVYGTDINPRAVAFARFNAHLNDVADRCVFRIGDLYHPIRREADRAFDVVLANPPFVPSPRRGRQRLLFRDGGITGDAVVRRVVRGLARRLTDDGVAVVVLAAADLRGRSFESTLARWLGTTSRLRAAFLETDRAEPEAFAAAHAARLQGPGVRQERAAAARQWLEALRAAGVERVRGGVLVLARPPAVPAHPPAWSAALRPPPGRDAGLLKAVFEAGPSGRMLAPETLFQRVCRLAPGVQIRPSEAGADRARPGHVTVGPTGAERRVTPLVRAVLESLDGRRSLGEVVADVSVSAGVSPLGAAIGLTPALIDLVAIGAIETTGPAHRD